MKENDKLSPLLEKKLMEICQVNMAHTEEDKANNDTNDALQTHQALLEEQDKLLSQTTTCQIKWRN